MRAGPPNRQWAALGAQVRKAERGTLVLFYKELPRGTDADPTDGAPFVARAAYVFNAAQVDAPTPPADAPAPGAALDPLPAFDAFVTGTGATIRHGGTRACYVPTTDTIHLPPSSAFHTPTGYAGTLAHELVHWTGAPHRLARDLTGRFGARAYAAEELVAELGAAFVLADLGVARTPHPDHAAYCASWAPLLRADPRALSTAAAQASHAARPPRRPARHRRPPPGTGFEPGGRGRRCRDRAGGGHHDHRRGSSHLEERGVSAAVPVPSRRVLAELHHGTASGDGSGVAPAASPALARAFARLDTALDAHAAAITALDRIENALAATHGYPRVPLPADDGTDATAHFASDAATIARRLGTATPAARRLTAALRRRQRTFTRAATAAGLGPARARETRAARTVSAATARLLLIPALTPADLTLKLTVLIAAGEHTPDDAHAFPWLYLRAIFADLGRPDRPELHSRR